MLRRITMNKIFRYTVLLLIVFAFYLFPNKNNNAMIVNKEIKKSSNYHDIFLFDKNKYISKTSIMVKSLNNEDLLKELIECLNEESKYQDRIPNGFKGIIPKGTKLINYEIKDKLVILDFNDKLLTQIKSKEEKMVEAIIYTVTSINDFENVTIKVNGEILRMLPKNNVTINEVLNRNYGINKIYDIDNLNNITSVTIYYISKVNENAYYVPVTKYLNSEEDKVKIIIDELTGKLSYESNLMSFLNYNAKLINYELKENEINLNFNEYLFDSNINKKVLEEVIYSISYSLKDSINVSNINFYVNGKKI